MRHASGHLAEGALPLGLDQLRLRALQRLELDLELVSRLAFARVQPGELVAHPVDVRPQ